MKATDKPIWMVTHWFPKVDKPSQGIFILEHLEAFKKCGVPIEVISIQFGKGLMPSAKAQKVKYGSLEATEITLSGVSPKLWYAAPWSLMFLFKGFIKKALSDLPSPRLINSHVALPAGYFGDFIAESEGVPHVVTEHWSKTQKHLKGQMFGFSSSKTLTIYARAKAISTVSNFLKDSMFSGIDMPQTPIYITPNVIGRAGIEPKIFNEDPVNILMVANWKDRASDPKRPELAMKAIARFSQESGRKVALTLAGGGDGQEKLKKAAAELGLTTRFPGFLDKESLFALMHEHDLFMHASITETFSLVIAEALKNGLPVIASKVGAIPEVMHSDQWGWVVENTEDAFVNALLLWNENPLDKAKIYSENADRFTPETVVKSFMEVYKTIG
jgi:glycosyltransferase involved in cell wall biosynthesis